MSVRFEIEGVTYEIDMGKAAQAAVENDLNRPFKAAFNRFLQDFTGDTNAIMTHCIKVITAKGSEPFSYEGWAQISQNPEQVVIFVTAIKDAVEEWGKSIGVKMAFEPPTSGGVSTSPPKASGNSEGGK